MIFVGYDPTAIDKDKAGMRCGAINEICQKIFEIREDFMEKKQKK